jgi:hypothetical protein
MSIINIVRLYCDELLDGDAAPGLGGALWPSAPSDSSAASTITPPSSSCLKARWITGSANPAAFCLNSVVADGVVERHS